MSDDDDGFVWIAILFLWVIPIILWYLVDSSEWPMWKLFIWSLFLKYVVPFVGIGAYLWITDRD